MMARLWIRRAGVAHAIPCGVVMLALLAVALPALPAQPSTKNHGPEADWLSPTAITVSPDGRVLYLACATGNRVAVFDTPGLIEVWRTGPYLHDGRAPSLRDVLTLCNPEDRHGVTSKLSSQEIEDLAEFVLSL